jgi:hypothetical protein
MSRDFFADTVGAVHVTGNLVRFDLTSLQPGEGQGRQEVTQRLIMPLEGFVSAFNLQEQVIRQLTQNGVLVDGRVFPASPTAPAAEDEDREEQQ